MCELFLKGVLNDTVGASTKDICFWLFRSFLTLGIPVVAILIMGKIVNLFK